MKEIKLSQGKVALVDDEDFSHLNQWKWFFGAGGYAVRNRSVKVDPKRGLILMHQIILPPINGFDNDHIDRNKLNNQRYNLRHATRSVNLVNRARWGKTSKYRGVCYQKKEGVYVATITVAGKHNYLGCSADEMVCARMYDQAASIAWGFDAELNFPGEDPCKC